MAVKRARQRPGEFALIDRYFRPLAQDRGAFALKDDAALYRQRPGDDLLFKADMVVAGVHFLPDDPARSIARKALRVNLSDLAAKGGEPFGYLLSLALPATWTEAWIAEFARGLAADQKAYGVTLLGGDTSLASGGVTVAITAIGRVPKGEAVLRSGARPGDAIFVSGTIGDAALGLRLRQGTIAGTVKGAKHLLDRYLHPQPRVALAAVVRRHATSTIDVSDGLVGDLGHICETSGVGAEIGAHLVPLSPAAKAVLAGNRALLPVVLYGGDDYEIVATVPEKAVSAFIDDAKAAGVPVTRIGRITAGKGRPVVRDAAGRTISVTTKSHTHF
ncbi:MAG: thiamine-phosphate kinase [Bauldia sp.]|nr:thiamine-phosphate kinase [Bauldia sp.]